MVDSIFFILLLVGGCAVESRALPDRTWQDDGSTTGLEPDAQELRSNGIKNVHPGSTI
jgi:hypothetical protein